LELNHFVKASYCQWFIYRPYRDTRRRECNPKVYGN